MIVTINDRTSILQPGTTLAEALLNAGIPSTGIATAVNGEVVPAAQRVSYQLNEGDRILIIKAFYGG